MPNFARIAIPWVEPLIKPERLTIGGLAKKGGYRSACIGKWHLDWDWPNPAERKLSSISKAIPIR